MIGIPERATVFKPLLSVVASIDWYRYVASHLRFHDRCVPCVPLGVGPYRQFC